MRKSILMASAGIMAFATPAFAQDTQPADGAQPVQENQDDDIIEDEGAIVITATRRNEALSDVPLAVSAVTAESLLNSGASDIRQLTQVSPSLLVSSTSSEAGAGVARIRGIGTVGDNPGLESSVAVFIDGVYRSRTGTGLTELGQVDRIEVLRGPQGTLFGRNASAGLISIITAQPRFTPEVIASATIGNYNMRRGELSVTGPLSDNVAGRIDGVYLSRDGFLTDRVSGRDINDRDRFLVRGQLLWEPDSDLSVRLVGDYSSRDEECCGATYLPAQDYDGSPQPSTFAALLRGLGADINDDTFVRETSITPGQSFRSDVEDYGLSAEVVYDLGDVELTSISAYRFNEFVRGQDATFNNLDLLFRDDDGGAATTFKTFTQELRLQGEAMDGRLDWLVGGFFASEKLELTDNLTVGDDFSKYANCLTAFNFASSPLVPSSIIDPSNPTCFQPLVSGAVRAGLVNNFNTALGNMDVAGANAIASQIAALSAFARLGAIDLGIGPSGQFPDFGAGVFNDSGYSNLALALGMLPADFDINVNDRYDQLSTNWAIFTHNIFEVTDQIDITIGLRYTQDKKSLDVDLNDDNALCSFFSAAAPDLQTLPCLVPSTPGGNFTASDDFSNGQLSGTGVISFKPVDDLLTYASYSRGYKAGGYNLDRTPLLRSNGNGAIVPNSSIAVLQFEPEINDAFEVGFKYDGDGIDINVAAFHQVFESFQLNQFNGLAFEVENINGCSELDVPNGDADASPLTGNCVGDLKGGVRSAGVEWEIFSRPMRDLQINFGGTYADTRYRSEIVGADGEAVSPQLFQLNDRYISNANELTLTGSIAWTPDIGDSGLTGLVYVDGRHMSSLNTGSDLDVEKLQPSFQVFNARLGIRGPDDIWAVELWAQNFTNEEYIQVAFDAPLQGFGTGLVTNTARGVDEGLYPTANQLFGAFLGEPRTYGLTLRGRF
ncbi:TonB-dependent receptor [Sphingomicrobium sediminis]|uniref:TonB-dependent receptor n=1 Tax=Sphingomicrobium sediminis TaxID=2950949 RepID=A0A9X2EJF6_9SPHN|nr:TonB-dependent receptor [Sphingomicrobium sediminis]MCM8557896.1 TonB-dependent receptor [Sphingomicrobium sediminis]